MAKKRVDPRAWISLDVEEGVALLGAALRERPWDAVGPVYELASAVGRLGGADYSRAITLRPKDFAFSKAELLEYPAIWAFCANELPRSAEHIDQETPISRRLLDDAIKCLIPVFVRRAERLFPSCRVDLGVKPVRWPEYYKALPYWRECEPQDAETAPRGRGKYGPRYNDGFLDAVSAAVDHQQQAAEAGGHVTNERAAEFAIDRCSGHLTPAQAAGLEIEEIAGRVVANSKASAVKRVAAELARVHRGFDDIAIEAPDRAEGGVEKQWFVDTAAATAEDLKWRAIAAAAIDARIAAGRSAFPKPRLVPDRR